jgi:hypothetical protein
MASELTMLPRETCTLSKEAHDLLHAALLHWNDVTVFDDVMVAQVKPAFQRWLIETALNKQQHLRCVLRLQSEPGGPCM